MRKQFDLEKLVQEVMGPQQVEGEEIDDLAEQAVEALQQYVELVQKYLRGELPRAEAETQITAIWAEIDRLQMEQQYWWLPFDTEN